MTNFGIAPYYKSVALERIKECPCFVISYNKSLNPVTQTCEMDMLACYFDETEERLKTRYLDSQFLGHGTSNDLKKSFNLSLKVLNENKSIQVGIDDPNVNIKLENDPSWAVTKWPASTDWHWFMRCSHNTQH